MNVSVILITYNGSSYLQEQLRSILDNFDQNDELIIIDDCSCDNTIKLAEQVLSEYDVNYIIHQNEKNIGIRHNIVLGTMMAKNDIVVYSDQDDIWLNNKLERIKGAFTRGIALYVHNAQYCGTDLNNLRSDLSFEHLKTSKSIVKNLFRNGYIGCCMAIDRRYFQQKVLQKVRHSVMHDWYLSSYALTRCMPIEIDHVVTMLHRRHAHNLTPKSTSLFEKIIMRLRLLRSLI